MYTCGLRISEAATLQVRAIDGINGFVRVIGKGDKERCVPLTAVVRYAATGNQAVDVRMVEQLLRPGV